MSPAVLAIGVIALLDGAFSGYRAAQGRTGRLSSRRRDAVAHLRGVVVWTALVAAPVCVGLLTAPPELRGDAAGAVAVVLVPFALVTVTAIVGWYVLPWRWRYLAMAVVMGPMTLLRPIACLAAVAAVWIGTGDPTSTVLTAVVGSAQLLVEPVVGKALVHPR